MIATTTTIEVSDEARAYVTDRGLDQPLTDVMGITDHVFRGAHRVDVLLHEDPDVANLRWLIVRVAIDLDTWEHGRAARAEWYARTAEALPTALKNEFGLEIERGPG